ncbi:MAG: RHS repeat-associated core domain-containing protein, partial [Bacteroidales bacterium]|nr:RHS repeat-associated core domain-containing protein [Bacteroidales bacterium]
MSNHAAYQLTQNGQTTTLTYLSGPEGLFAVVVKEPNGTSYIRYIHTDHLGSWNTITGENGNLLQELSFDAWGNRRNPNTWRAFATTPAEPLFDRGFTGHEHLYGFQLINMNGRMYDPVVSRMLSPDNFVQAPDFSQSFNRYSYCWNNPLIYTDPSGEFIFTLATLIAAPFTGGASLALLPTAIGADIGMWQGGTLANGGEMNPFKWDYSSGKTWGYMLGG